MEMRSGDAGAGGGGGAGGGAGAGASEHDGYRSPLVDRYASKAMQGIWSARRKFETWRTIWLAVAEAQHAMGLPVTKEQVEELRANLEVTDADIALAKEYEAKLRHDVMAHVHAWGERCPKAKGIIHLGMTSQDVNDNAELLLIYQSIGVITERIERLMVAIGSFAERWRGLPTLGFTHYQAAQPTTVGRRAAMWLGELLSASDVRFVGDDPRLRGLRGATGTQASYLQLMDGDPARVARLEALVVYSLLRDLGEIDAPSLDEHLASMDEIVLEEYEKAAEIERKQTGCDSDPFPIELLRIDDQGFVDLHTTPCVGQTYPRSFDGTVVAGLASVAGALHKIASDIRLLCNHKELDEPFERNQIGSSAMPYKRNPMRCERVCGLARFVMNLVPNAYHTAATQWLERTLDDSSNRRLVLPEAFLGLDACLNIMHNVVSGLVVHEAQVRKNLMEELPFLATENFMMEAVKLGRDRQAVHEAIRKHAMASAQRIKQEGAANDLLERLRGEPLLAGVDLDAQMDPMLYVGLSVQQTERFLREVVDPIREGLGEDGEADGGEGLRV
ncbi:MAG: lyase family protein [Phycisphaerales bacterium]